MTRPHEPRDVVLHPVFRDWLDGLTDHVGKARVLDRIAFLSLGHLGDAKRLKDVAGVLELRVHAGPGYRLYLTERSRRIVVLLCGGDKSSQDKDIRRARKLAKEV